MAEVAQHAEADVPRADRPYLPEGYGVPASADGMLAWDYARDLLESTITYWVGTTRPDGRPHAVPIWGVWLDDQFWFEGGPDTRRGRNLAANPAVVVHLERGESVVIVEGTAREVPGPDAALAARLVAAFAKYGPTHNYVPDPAGWAEGGLYTVQPAVVLAWSHFPGDATRWRFASQ